MRKKCFPEDNRDRLPLRGRTDIVVVLISDGQAEALPPALAPESHGDSANLAL